MPRPLVSIILFLHRKNFTVSSTEFPQTCLRDFQSSNLEFGGAYTYVIERQVSSSVHPTQSAGNGQD